MKIIISPRAEKDFKKLPKISQIIVARKIKQFGEGRIVQEEKLSGFPNIFRVRVGDFRIVFRRTSAEIYLILIGHRKDVYDLLRRLF